MSRVVNSNGSIDGPEVDRNDDHVQEADHRGVPVQSGPGQDNPGQDGPDQDSPGRGDPGRDDPGRDGPRRNNQDRMRLHQVSRISQS